jgi:ubiquinone/menaquinone biosynthesis C-methylase UbiE
MRQALHEMWRQLKPGGYLVLVAANNRICGRTFRTPTYLQLIAEQLGFRTVLRLVDDIRSRGLMTKRNQTASIITREWVLVFSKDPG